MPLVSVIVPNFNHSKFLKKRLDSVFHQTFTDYEVIILDDCSTDNSKDIISEYRNQNKISHIVFNEKNSGSTFHQWKKGLKLARGKYIWFAESDDFASEEFLATVIQPFLQFPDMLISYCQSMLVDDENNPLGLHRSGLRDGSRWEEDFINSSTAEVSDYLSYINTIPNASAVVFKKVEGVEECIPDKFKFCGDWIFWKSILNKGGKIAFDHKPLNFFRVHRQTTRSVANVSINNEVQRFAEYRSFVKRLFMNVFESKYDWMLDEWSARRKVFKKNLFQFCKTRLHPTLALRFYLIYVKIHLSRLMK